MIYVYKERHGQIYIGYFVNEPANGDNPKGQPRLIKRTQHRSRKVADGHFSDMVKAAARRFQTWTVVLVLDADRGHINPYKTEQEARDAATAGRAFGVQRAYLFSPEGTVEEAAAPGKVEA